MNERMPNNGERSIESETVVSMQESKEGAPNKVHDFFELDIATEKRLRENIEKLNGVVRVFIHPDFEEYSVFKGTQKIQKEAQRLEQAEAAFQRILSSQSEDLPELFIFETAQDIDEFEEKVARIEEIAKRDVYSIRTEFANPDPLSPHRKKSYEWQFLRGWTWFGGKKITDEERAGMWEMLINKFKQLGVRKILIGGLELYMPQKEGEQYGGCLGKAIKHLKDAFEIELSLLTWPGTRKKPRSKNGE